jgi:hypothetical protein
MRSHSSNAALMIDDPQRVPATAGEATWGIRPRTGEHFLSARSRELLGIEAHEPVSIQRLVAAVYPEDRERWKSAMEGLLDPEGTGELRVDFRAAESPFRWLTAKGHAFFDGLTPVRVVGSLLEATSLGEICQEAVEEATLDYPDHPIHFERWDDALGEWDADRLAEVAENLIWNAVVHSDAGAPIIVSVVNCGDQALMIVANLGEPVPERIREHLLEPEHRDSELCSRSVLCTTLELVRAPGGRIELSSENDSTVFHVWLPKAGPARQVPMRRVELGARS